MKDKIRLIVVTFIEGLLAAWAVSGFTLEADVKVVLGGGIAAAASAAYNVIRDIKSRIVPVIIDSDDMGFAGAEGVPSSEDEEVRQ
jgi:type IV secretory pathway TrbF-like protein